MWVTLVFYSNLAFSLSWFGYFDFVSTLSTCICSILTGSFASRLFSSSFESSIDFL